MNILFATALILFALITAYKTRLGLYLILILIPTFLIRTQIAGIPTTFLELSIYLLATIWIFKKIKNKNYKLEIKNLKLKIYKPFLFPTLLFITAFIISTIISPDKRLSLGILKGWLFDPLLFTLILIDQVKTRIHFTRVIGSLGLMTLWVSVYGIYEYFVNPRNLIEYSRLDSVFTSANYVTMLLVPPTILIFSYLLALVRLTPARMEKDGKEFNNAYPKQSRRVTMKQCLPRLVPSHVEGAMSRGNNETIASWSHGFTVSLLILTTAISLAAIYLTRSFSGWLGLAAGLLTLILLYPTKRKLKTTIITTLIIVSTLFLSIQKDNPKLHALTDFSGRTATHARLQIYKTSYNIIKDNPILGIGLGNFHNGYLKYVLLSVSNPLEYNVLKPHNLYLNLWLETGLLGLLAFLWLIVIFVKFAKMENGKWKMENIAITSAMTGLLTQGLFDTPYFKNDLSLLFWLLIGLSIINTRRDAGVVEQAALEKR